MVTTEHVRQYALSLPESAEADHHGFPSFRVGGKIFATMPDAEHLNVMLDATGIDEVLAEAPAGCAELWWGKQRSGVRVTTAEAAREVIEEVLTDAWRRRAPKRAMRAWQSRT